MGNIAIAFLLTLLAGLSTGIGSLIAFLAKPTNTKFLAISLGFSAGVMIYVSMIELMDTAKTLLTENLGKVSGSWATVGGFFGGILVIALIDKLVPEAKNPHEFRDQTPLIQPQNQKNQIRPTPHSSSYNSLPENKHSPLFRMGVVTALVIAIHNFPEGLATFVAALQEPKIAIPIAVAIAIHNIPEGVAVAVPIYQSTGSKKKAFTWSFASGLAEPAGAVIGYLVLSQFLNDTTYGIIFAAIAGIMVFISLDELLPAAHEYDDHHLEIYGLIAGMAVMAVSLLLFID